MKFVKSLKQFYYAGLMLFMITPASMLASSSAYEKMKNSSDDIKIVTSVQTIGGTLFKLLESFVQIVRVGSVYLAFAFAALGWFMGSAYIKKKQEQNQGQEPPSIIRYGAPIGATIAGFTIVFIVVGAFGMMFMDMSISEAWKWAVVDVVKDAGGVSSNNGGGANP